MHHLNLSNKTTTSSPVLVAHDWKIPFCGHIEVPKAAAGRMFTQISEDEKDRMISIFSKKSSREEHNYNTNDRELLETKHF